MLRVNEATPYIYLCVSVVEVTKNAPVCVFVGQQFHWVFDMILRPAHLLKNLDMPLSAPEHNSSKVGSNIPHKMRIEDYLHSDVMKPQGFALRQPITV